MSKLVIVESPAKAKTISRFLGKEYEVLASFGHVRDLPESASDIPEEYKKKKWAKLGVNTEENFEPLYIVPDDKKKHVSNLRAAAKGIDELLLATDEDREGESISWHIQQLLKPSSKVKVRRIVFHEITPEAIEYAIKNPRDVDYNLVKAQETRRILDRLYGYTLSPVLWKKVAPKLSAGRVQSVAVRLCVERERERQRFVTAEYWDLEATFGHAKGPLGTKLTQLDNLKVANGSHFDAATGKIASKTKDILWVDRNEASALAADAKIVDAWKVAKLDKKPGTEQPPKPFQTSTLQQEASRKLRFSSKQTMQVAQTLYEGVDFGGDRVGLITYMRTDSMNLAEKAITQTRETITSLYGKEYLPANPARYKTNAKGAQEAHEAIRPTDMSRKPADMKKYLTPDQFALYELIWMRTIACQMVAARIERTSVDVTGKGKKGTYNFTASGKAILFPGFLRAYVEGSDDPDSEIEGKEKILPEMKVGDSLILSDLGAKEHHTSPPARYTEASLIKRLEEEGIGRPSTYVSILSTITDRGYINRRQKELVPSFTAFAVTELLEKNFFELVDTKFTAKMESDLDDIAEGEGDATAYLKAFFLGENNGLGLEKSVEEKTPDIEYPQILVGNDPISNAPIVVRIGRYGPFLQRGEGGDGHRGSVSAEMPPADLTMALALEILDGQAQQQEAIGIDPITGRGIMLKSGRFGAYLEVEQTPEELESKEKPRRISLPPGMKASDVQPEDVPLLASFPRDLGNHPESDEPVTVWIGRFGPFVKCGAEIRNIANWRDAAEVELESALEILAAPKTMGRGATARTPASALKDFGTGHEDFGHVKIMDGRYGPYATNGTIHATLPKGKNPSEFELPEVLQLLRDKQAMGPSKGKKKKAAPKTFTKATVKAKPKAKATAKSPKKTA